MPIRVQNALPAKEILEHENIFVMDEDRAHHQDIRPLEILMLNLMPEKEETELQMLRCLSNTPIQVNITFMMVSTHKSKNTSMSHLNRFYQYFDDVKDQKFDGLIITGAPIEHLEYEEVDFWPEFTMILDWAESHVTSTVFQCWGCQAAMYYFYGIQKRQLDKKLFGIYYHRVLHRKIPLVRGFDDVFMAPHSRHTDVDINDIRNCDKITILAESDEAGFLLGMADDGRKIFIQGHPEYERYTLDTEYKRDLKKGLEIAPPVNYYIDNDPANKPLLTWRSISFNLYANWLNYYVYQTTPYNLVGTPEIFGNSKQQ